MIVDRAGYRFNVGIILVNEEGSVFLARRLGHNAWQFPQGGLNENETVMEALYRELKEEVGLEPTDVIVMGYTRHWLKYRLPKQYLRPDTRPLVIGQKQRWFLLRLKCSEQKVRLDLSESPEFDSWRWADYWDPVSEVIYFKQQVYRQALKELEPLLKGDIPNQLESAQLYPSTSTNGYRRRGSGKYRR